MITLIFPTNFVCVHMLTVMFYKHSTDNNIIEYITGEANTQRLKIMTRKLVFLGLIFRDGFEKNSHVGFSAAAAAAVAVAVATVTATVAAGIVAAALPTHSQ